MFGDSNFIERLHSDRGWSMTHAANARNTIWTVVKSGARGVVILRIPSEAEFAAYDGAHCARLWKEVGDQWACPSCRRTKMQIMRWTRRNPKPLKGITEHYMGWMAGLHRHHDHGSGDAIDSGRGRFPGAVLCDQCNAADGIAKRRLGLPSSFSFSPSEISQFVQATPHGKHKIDFEKARDIFDGI